MGRRFEYRIVSSQDGKVTYVDYKWIGAFWSDHSKPSEVERMYASCPELVPYLQQAGAEGWELVSSHIVTHEKSNILELIFKREIFSSEEIQATGFRKPVAT